MHPSNSKPAPNSFAYTPSLPQRALIQAYKSVNKLVPWHKLPTIIGVLNLSAFRYELRQKNLHDVYPSPDYQGVSGCPQMVDEEFLHTRHSDGLFNDLGAPKMGCAGMRFGRNVPREFTTRPSNEELMSPNPRQISEELLKRNVFKPATTLNLLAAAWIQFQVHDWFQHTNSTTEKHSVPLPAGDTWPSPDATMSVEQTVSDEALSETDKKTPGYKNENTHWWDGSQIYGSSEARTAELRGATKNGKLSVDDQGYATFLPRDADGVPQTGFSTNWWLGLELLHTVFVLEHNAICGALSAAYPKWSSDKLFDTARLVNCALMAKIHTVEWTPAILAHPALKISMNANWWGILGERLYKLIGRVSSSEAISGIPGSTVEHHAAPYSLTEEFVSVYRMHSLIPDTIAFFESESGAHKTTYAIQDTAFGHARDPLEIKKGGLSFEDALYSFGINYPGAITINNMPSFLRDLHTPDGRHLDLGTLDILRDRERGVPRYNTFRRLFHMPAQPSFIALTGGDADLASKLSKLYNDDIETVDLLVGCLCEPLPKGFGFSDTAFRVFILMASRRLKSDRFIAGNWDEKTYSKVGMEWVQNNGMKDVLGRHFPGLKGVLGDSQNPFAPWTKLAASNDYEGVETNA
ncbi:heme peroxidase [Paraphoma chrysanthemicola]|uniref:Heme peroxidase n=1 Tax=Paraphoma chrysanthemicola TaxID=798071 RepID=A0A8K0RHZ4_9PLEO|nr:heme peroxidase [Paraphoma chrysanthemicola]